MKVHVQLQKVKLGIWGDLRIINYEDHKQSSVFLNHLYCQDHPRKKYYLGKGGWELTFVGYQLYHMPYYLIESFYIPKNR